MKLTIPTIILVSSSLFAMADETPPSLVHVNETQAIKIALDYINRTKPEIAQKQLEFSGLQYLLNNRPAGYYKTNGGDTQFVKTGEKTEWLTVTFKQTDSGTKIVKEGRNCIQYKAIAVNFSAASTKELSTSDSTITEYGDVVKKDKVNPHHAK